MSTNSAGPKKNLRTLREQSEDADAAVIVLNAARTIARAFERAADVVTAAGADGA